MNRKSLEFRQLFVKVLGFWITVCRVLGLGFSVLLDVLGLEHNCHTKKGTRSRLYLSVSCLRTAMATTAISSLQSRKTMSVTSYALNRMLGSLKP